VFAGDVETFRVDRPDDSAETDKVKSVHGPYQIALRFTLRLLEEFAEREQTAGFGEAFSWLYPAVL
jgi:hypothetical protein